MAPQLESPKETVPFAWHSSPIPGGFRLQDADFYLPYLRACALMSANVVLANVATFGAGRSSVESSCHSPEERAQKQRPISMTGCYKRPECPNREPVLSRGLAGLGLCSLRHHRPVNGPGPYRASCQSIRKAKARSDATGRAWLWA
jgi:hypothetical protein